MSETSAVAASASDGAGAGLEGAGGGEPLAPASSGSEFDAGRGGEAGGAGMPAPPAAQPSSPVFKFGRREWPSQQRAEQEFLNTIGRLQSVQRQLGERDRELETLRAAVAGIRGGGPGGAEGAGAPGKAETAAEAVQRLLDPDSLDWELITGAMQERGPEVGLYLLTQKIAEALEKGFDGRTSKLLEPFKGMHEGSQRAVQAGQLWDGAVTATDEEGNLFFPELADPGNLQTAMAIWREITDGMPPEVAMHPRMARMAILELRAMQAAEGGGAVSSGSADAGSQVDPGAVAAQAARAAGQRAAGRGALPSGRGTAPGARERAESEGDRIKRSLLTAGQETGGLGFRR